MALPRRMMQEHPAQGLTALTDLDVLADLDLRQLFSVLPISPVARLEGRSDCGEIALQAIRRVAVLNSETRAAVP